MNRRALARTHRVLIDRLAFCSLVLIVAVALATPVRAAEAMIDTIVVRLRDDSLPLGTLLSAQKRASLGLLLRNSVTESGRTRDGALRLTLAHPVPFVEARDAINRLRMQPDVLYASISASPQALAQKSLAAGAGFPAEPLISQMIIKYRDPALTAASNRNEALPATHVNRLSMATGRSVTHLRAMSGGAWVVQLSQSVTRGEAVEMAKAIEADPGVEYADPDLPAEKHVVPNDPNFAVNQWDLQPSGTALGGANLQGAWNITTGSASIVVADIDTGILPHPDLAGRTVAGYDMITNAATANDGGGRDADPTDPGDWIVANECFAGSPAANSSWHGTHTAGTIAAATNNAAGIAGINWVSKVQAVRVLGKCGGMFSDIIDGITWAYGGAVPGVPANATPARVINMSLGGTSTCIVALQNAITAAVAAGTVVVVSAGNTNPLGVIVDNTTPANCNGVITVASVGKLGNRAYYSHYDDGTPPTYVAIAAPGGEQSFANDPLGTLSTLNAGTTTVGAYNYIYYQGTSMAAPHVTGIASLMLSANPNLTPAQVLSKIQTTARAFPTGTAAGRDCTSNIASVTSTTKYCGAGIIDATAAVNSVVAKETIGLYNAATQTFFLRNTNDSGPADLAFSYGGAGSVAITGDWNGDGITTIGVYQPATGAFFLKNSNSAGPADIVFQFGAGGTAVPLVGDWNGDGVDTIGLYIPATGTFFLKNSNSAGPADIVFNFGVGGAGVLPVVGDWNGDGIDTIGLYIVSSGVFFLKNTNSAGPADIIFTFGVGGANVLPITGDWDNNGSRTVGLYNTTTGAFFLKNTNANGPADLVFSFGVGGAVPLSGDWDNLP